MYYNTISLLCHKQVSINTLEIASLNTLVYDVINLLNNEDLTAKEKYFTLRKYSFK